MGNNAVTDTSRIKDILEMELLSVNRILAFYTNGSLATSSNQAAELAELQAIQASLQSSITQLQTMNTNMVSLVNKNLPYGADSMYATNPDGNGNYQIYTFKKSGATVKTLTFTFDGNDNVTSLVES